MRQSVIVGMVLAATLVGTRPAWAADTAPDKLPGSDLIPTERLTDWRPGVTVGVPGGIPERKDPANIINVREAPYLAAGSDKSTTGSIEAGSDVLTVAAPIDLKVGQAVRIPGEAEVAELTLTAGADADAKVSFSIVNPKWQSPGTYTVDVKNGDSPETIAKKIGSIYLNGWGKKVEGNTVAFTALYNQLCEITFDPGESSVRGTVRTLNDGSSDLVARIIEIRGNQVRLSENAPATRTDKTVFHDDTDAIRSAIKAAQDEQVVYVPAGTYLISSGINVGAGGKRITLRGAGPDRTVLMGHVTSGSIISISDSGGADYQWKWPNADITGSPSKGAKVLEVAVGDVPVGALCQISLKNDPKLPVWSHSNWEYLRKQKCRIVAKTATTVTIEPPLLFDLPAALEPKLNAAKKHAEFCGIEDLALDGTHSTHPRTLASIGQGYGCWVKNVSMTHAPHYVFDVDSSLFCEVRHCTIGHRKLPFGPNGGSILFGGSTGCLVEDNIVIDTFPHMEIDASSGNVFAYNFCDDSGVMGGLLGCTINGNHGPHSNFNLYEGNYAPKFQSDGYHGSASHDTLFRNWFHGTSSQTENFWICVNLNRFSRDYSIVGNILGTKGYDWIYDNGDEGFGGFGYNQHFIYMFGMPNMGNGAFSGKAQASKGDYWSDWEKLRSSPVGRGPGPGGFQELDLDVNATTIRKGNYNFRDNGVPVNEALGDVPLPKSFYLAETPAWFGDLAWPPFGPDQTFEKNKIPAQVRYEAMVRK